MGTLKGVGRVYQQTFLDAYAKVGFAKLYDRKTPVTAADLLNDRVIPVEKSSAPKGLHNHERIDLLMKEVATEEPFDKEALRK